MDDSGRLHELLDRRDIEDVVFRYCRGIDRIDRELVRSCYHPDASDDHGSFRGSVDEFLDWVFRLLARYSQTMHFVGNVLVELEGDVAAAETYGIAFHRSERNEPQLNLMTGFRYLDRFEKRDGAWKIADRRVVIDWTRASLPGEAWSLEKAFGLRGGRREEDPSHGFLADDPGLIA